MIFWSKILWKDMRGSSLDLVWSGRIIMIHDPFPLTYGHLTNDPKILGSLWVCSFLLKLFCHFDHGRVRHVFLWIFWIVIHPHEQSYRVPWKPFLSTSKICFAASSLPPTSSAKDGGLTKKSHTRLNISPNPCKYPAGALHTKLEVFILSYLWLIIYLWSRWSV